MNEPDPVDRSPWARLATEARSDLQRVLRAQIDHAGRAGSDDENVAHGAAPEAYEAFKASGAPSEAWPAHYFDHGLSPDGRRIILSVYAKAKADGIWTALATCDRLDPESPWPGMHVIPTLAHGEFVEKVSELGFGDWFGASRPPRWGVRSNRRGWQFHLIGPHPDWDPRFVEMHLDAACPGKLEAGVKGILLGAVRGVKHWWIDTVRKSSDRIADRLEAGLAEQGIGVPSVE